MMTLMTKKSQDMDDSIYSDLLCRKMSIYIRLHAVYCIIVNHEQVQCTHGSFYFYIFIVQIRKRTYDVLIKEEPIIL